MLKVIDRLCTVIGVVCYISGSTRTFIEALGFVPLGITFTLCSCPNKRSRKILEQFRKTCVFCSPTEHKKNITSLYIPGESLVTFFLGKRAIPAGLSCQNRTPDFETSPGDGRTAMMVHNPKNGVAYLYIYIHTLNLVYIYIERETVCIYIYIFI